MVARDTQSSQIDDADPVMTMRFASTIFANAISLSVRLGANFVLNKVLAVLVGPAGFAMVGQLQNFMMLFQSATSGALTTGVTKLIAKNQDDAEYQRQIWTTAITSVVGVTLIIGLAIIFSHRWIARDLLGFAQFDTPVLLFAFGLTAFGIIYIIAAVFAGKSDVKPYSTLNGAIALFNLAVVSLGAYLGGIEGALIATAFSQSVAILFALYLLWRRKWYGLRIVRPLFDPVIAGNLARYGLMAMTAAAGLSLGQLIVRSQLIVSFGLEMAGLYDGLWRLASINQLLFSTTLMVYTLPRLSRLAHGPDFRSFYTRTTIVACALAGAVFTVEYLLRVPMFNLLFSSAFQPATKFFGFQCAGDIARVATLVTSTALVAQSRVLAYIMLEISRFAIFVVASSVTITAHQPEGAALAYMLSYGAAALIGFSMMLSPGFAKQTV